MITFIMCSRHEGGMRRDLKRLFDSAVEFISNYDNVEFLIKFDRDDTSLPDDEFFDQYPFTIKRYIYNRGEGRKDLHLFYNYLFAQRNPKSRFVMILTDKAKFIRKGFDEDILSNEEEYCIVSPFKEIIKEKYLNKFKDNYRETTKEWKHWNGNNLSCFSTKIIEVTQGFGWQANVDNWEFLLGLIMYSKYNINLWKPIDTFYHG